VEFKLRASCLWGRHSTAWGTTQVYLEFLYQCLWVKLGCSFLLCFLWSFGISVLHDFIQIIGEVSISFLEHLNIYSVKIWKTSSVKLSIPCVLGEYLIIGSSKSIFRIMNFLRLSISISSLVTHILSKVLTFFWFSNSLTRSLKHYTSIVILNFV
jgi:hypothetical protein